MSEDEKPPQKKSLFVRDIDALGILVKRAATLGAVLGLLSHLLHRCAGG